MAYINVQEETGGPLILVQDLSRCVERRGEQLCRDGMLAENQERVPPQWGLTWETKNSFEIIFLSLKIVTVMH